MSLLGLIHYHPSKWGSRGMVFHVTRTLAFSFFYYLTHGSKFSNLRSSPFWCNTSSQVYVSRFHIFSLTKSLLYYSSNIMSVHMILKSNFFCFMLIYSKPFQLLCLESLQYIPYWISNFNFCVHIHWEDLPSHTAYSIIVMFQHFSKMCLSCLL